MTMGLHDPTQVERCPTCGWVGTLNQGTEAACPSCNAPWPQTDLEHAKSLLVAAMGHLNARTKLYKKIQAFVHEGG